MLTDQGDSGYGSEIELIVRVCLYFWSLLTDDDILQVHT